MSYPEMESIVLLNKPHEAFLSVVTDLKNMGYHFLTVLLTEEENTGLSAPKVAIYELDVDNIDDRLHEQMSRVREKFPQIKFIAIYTSNLKYSMSEVYKLGFSNSFHLFFHRELFINEIFDLAPIELSTKSLNLDSLVRVNIIELEGQPLPFDLFVYLPSNKKTILYRPQGETLEDKTVEKFKKYSHYNLYIKKSDIGVYKKHCTKVLKNINANPAIPHALRNRQVAGEIKKLMAGFFTDEDLSIGEGKQLLDNASRIVEDYIKETCTDKKLLEAVEKIAGEHMTNYSHSKNVAAYCTLFGMSQGVGTPEDLHMGGLLHDIGMADLPEEMLWKSEKEMSETELSQYKLHPGNGRLELRTKKLKLSQNIIDMILQHHEKPDGSGFPYGMVANEINPLAKICAFADEFDRLTSIREGQRLYTPVEAMERISGQDGEDPADFYEVNFHSQLVDDFKNEKPFTLELPESIQPQVGETTDEDIDEGLVEASEIILPDKESKSQNIPVFETAEEVYLAKDVVEFEELLAANGEKIGFDDLKFDDDIDPITERKHQMFLKAAKEGNLELIDEFLDDGLDINIQDETGNTALMIASQSGQLETLQHLLSKGADTEILNQLNQSAIDIAAGSQQKSLFEALEQ
ncbi:MAG: HD domain-containing protein, partial [Bdellovibrionales bacterium]|nr:HD domain-containing protein [Bdellovibrionales bacterium]